MNRSVKLCTIALPLVALVALPALADVKTRDRSQIHIEGALGKVAGWFGGKAMKEGVESTVAVKGDRKATFNDTTGRIVDLSEEKVYDLDMHKKSYTVTTFDELRRRMREAEEKAKQQAAKEQPPEKAQAPKEQQQPQVEVDFDVKETGQKKQVAGYDTHESVATVTIRQKGKTLEDAGGLVMTADMWLGPAVPQMKEEAEFELRYWQKLQGPDAAAISVEQMAQITAMYPMVKDAMARMQKEGAKMQGTPLDTTTTFDAVKSKDELTEESQNSDSNGGGGGLSGMLARKMMKKKKDDGPTARATIFTIHHEILEIATTVSAADVAVPAGFSEKK